MIDETKYKISGWHSGGGCLHGYYDDKVREKNCYWLINHCDEHGEPDLQHPTNDQHPHTMFGLELQEVCDWDELTEYLRKKEKALYSFGFCFKIATRYDEGCEFCFITDFQNGYEIMVEMSNEIIELANIIAD